MLRTVLGLTAGLVLILVAFPYQSPASGPTTSSTGDSNKNTAEISSHDEATTFTVNVNLVLVRVVVRNAHGEAIGGLKKEDFQLFDNRKPQVISKFSIEELKHESGPSGADKSADVGKATDQESVTLPDRYIAYLFDDIHLEFGDLARVRQAVEKHIAGLQPTDRAAIFTTSGRNILDFTADRQKLLDALMRLRPNPISGNTTRQCPYVSYYMADMIVKGDPVALQAAIATTLSCVTTPGDPYGGPQAQAAVITEAQHQLELGDQETRVTLMTMQDVVRRVGMMPGQRSIVLVSPGFYNPDELQRQTELSDKALRSNVVINTLDARGLYTTPSNLFSDETTVNVGSNTPADTQASIQNTQVTDQNALVDGMVLGELADATGGTWFHNNNDFDEGLRLLSSPPSYSYLLGFSPQQLKPDGKFHTLKVTVKNPEKLAVQARKGYFAPKHEPNAADQAKQDIEDAVFSQEELHGLPVELRTQFFKQSDTAAQIAVLAHVKLRGIHFTKVDGRNRSDLTIVSALFDTNGNYIKGSEKVLEMRLRDQTLERKLDSGVTLKANFDVKPGSYLVRLVVRDAEGQIAAQNGAVEIPY